MNNFAFCLAFPHIFFFFCGSSGVMIEPPLQCFLNSLHDWNILTEFVFCPKRWVVHMKVFLTYNINKVYLQCKLSDAKGWDGMEGFAIRIAFMKFFSGMNSLMYVRCQLSRTSNTANSLYKNLAQSHFYAFNKILSVLPIEMPHRSIFSGCSFACREQNKFPTIWRISLLSLAGLFKVYS